MNHLQKTLSEKSVFNFIFDSIKCKKYNCSLFTETINSIFNRASKQLVNDKKGLGIKKLRYFLFALLTMSPLMAHSVLTQRDFLSTGDGLITLDTQTGLEWLDLTYTERDTFAESYTMIDILGQINTAGNPLNGFRYASVYEVETFFINAGLTVDNGGNYQQIGESTAVLNLLELIGSTLASSSINRYQSFGVTGSRCQAWSVRCSGDNLMIAGLGVQVDLGSTYATTDYYTLPFDEASKRADFGHFLVRAVPLPSAIWLLSTGIIILFGWTAKANGDRNRRL